MTTQQELVSLTGGMRHWLIVAGVLMLVSGIVAVMFPLAATLIATAFIGWLFIFTGVAAIVSAFTHRKSGMRFGTLTLGIVRVLAGVFLLINPLASAAVLTLLIASLFIVQGLFGTFGAFSIRPVSGWGWLLVSSIVSVVAGVLIAMDIPGASLVVLGLIIGVTFIADGIASLMLARMLPKSELTA